MISSKILVQSAAAGLMAGAILTSPLFVFCPGGSALHTTPSPSKLEVKQPDEAILRHQVRYEPPMLRAAPDHTHPSARSARKVAVVRPESTLHQRSLDERNRAANQALHQINKAYEHSVAEQQATGVAHAVTLHSRGKHAATQVHVTSEMLAKCGANDRKACRLLRHLLAPEQRGGLQR